MEKINVSINLKEKQLKWYNMENKERERMAGESNLYVFGILEIVDRMMH